MKMIRSYGPGRNVPKPQAFLMTTFKLSIERSIVRLEQIQILTRRLCQIAPVHMDVLVGIRSAIFYTVGVYGEIQFAHHMRMYNEEGCWHS